MGLYSQQGGKVPVGEPYVFKPGAGKCEYKEKHFYPIARRVTHVVFAKIYLSLLSIRELFHHLVFTRSFDEGQVMLAPYPGNKIENGLLGYFWQILEMLLQPIMHLGGWGVPEFIQSRLDKRLIRGQYFVPLGLIDHHLFELQFGHRKIFTHCPAVED